MLADCKQLLVEMQTENSFLKAAHEPFQYIFLPLYVGKLEINLADKAFLLFLHGRLAAAVMVIFFLSVVVFLHN